MFYKYLTSIVQTSLVPRPEKGRRKGPGFHCLRMRLIAVEFHQHHGRSIHVSTLVTSKRIPNVTWSVVIVVSECGVRFYRP